VVEDEGPVARFLEAGLTGLGYRPRVARSAEEALPALAGEGPFDLVLTDLGLPGMSGEEMARAIAAGPAPIPVVLLTGWADQIQAEGRRPAGVARVLAKPVTLATLAAALRDVCPGERARP
jgi:CheY-like chemotaxis protein